ncbi:MAG: bifunctional UDP-N-acetylglucosamine pyrophosphorylase/glucosamine-1-phosphate N-acetyltransferase [Enterobacterales bacterium]|jgi:bifunctional UDP-N-acetylglucosamine pyrophosphorylase/glucosamine-1-phosphate N-acetyltransferase
MNPSIKKLIEQGVKIHDPNRLDIRGSLECGDNTEIDINVIFEGKVVLGSNVKIGPHCIIKDSSIADNVEIKAYTMIEESMIGSNSFAGPYCRIRPGTKVGNYVQLGNFLEIKNTIIGDGCRINHMSFLGDAELGKKVTLGAGVITCNYDGKTTHETLINDDAFVGSGTNLIAPIEVGVNATIGAGSTITKNVEAEYLTLARSRQHIVKDWQGPKDLNQNDD